MDKMQEWAAQQGTWPNVPVRMEDEDDGYCD